MDLKKVCEIFKNVTLVRDGIFEGIGYADIKDIKKMMVFLRDNNYLRNIQENENISAVVTVSELADELIKTTNCGIIVCDKPDELFYNLHNYLYRKTDFYQKQSILTQIGKNAVIDSTAIIAERDVVIGDNVIIEPGVVIQGGVTIGNNCVIGANTTIGTRGFQYYRDGDEVFYIEHIGGVVLEDNVEVLSGCCIASGLIKPTYISENCKIDNLVHVGHSAFLDKRVLVTAGAVIGGSARIGKRVWVGINSVISASVHIGDDAFICMGAAVTRDVNANQKVSGNFAIEHKKQIENIKRISS